MRLWFLSAVINKAAVRTTPLFDIHVCTMYELFIASIALFFGGKLAPQKRLDPSLYNELN